MIYLFLKRMIDILISLISLVILFPFLLVVMLVLKFTGPGKVFYLQERVGLNNKKFTIYKFITMRENSEHEGGITYKGDPRILPVGKFLRKTKINELPQLFNMLKGDISIVGPRPLMEDGFNRYSDEIKKNIYLNNKPGLTGMGSLFFRDEENMLSQRLSQAKKMYTNKIMPVKGKLELWYKENRNLWIDFKIVVLTAVSIFFPKNKLHVNAFNGINKQLIAAYMQLVS
ncbi:MAG: sugar transferase [Spirochaetales bacterium]|nr:sugar transferase [Spirochaetales bacterium]